MQIQKFNKGEFKLTVFGSPEKPYFKAKEIALLLRY